MKNLLLTIALMLVTVSMQAQKISHIEILLSGKSFTRRKIRLKPSCGISASFVTLLVAKKGSSDIWSEASTTGSPFSKVHRPPTSAPNAHA